MSSSSPTNSRSNNNSDESLSSSSSSSSLMEEQWNLWPYFKESIKWHSDWTRWNSFDDDLSVKEHFKAYRHFTAHDDHYTMHRNTYFYEDKRGTVDEGPLSGPWKIDKHDPKASDPYGAIHAAADIMRTITAPDRSGAWLMKELPHGDNRFPGSGFELFLGDGENIRFSIGIIYDAAGQLTTVAAIREDSRDFGLFWSPHDSQPLRKYKHGGDDDDDEQLTTLLTNFWPTTTTSANSSATSFKVTVPGPVQTITEGVGIDSIDLESLKIHPKKLQEHDVVFEMPDGIVVICPSQLPEEESESKSESESSDNNGGEFVIAAGWKKKQNGDDGESSSWTSSVEGRYKHFVMSELVYTKVVTSG